MKTQLKGYMFWVAFVAALGGLLFGFDTAVISGAEKQIQQVYELERKVMDHLNMQRGGGKSHRPRIKNED